MMELIRMTIEVTAEQARRVLDVLREYIMYFNLACDLYGKEEYKIEIK